MPMTHKGWWLKQAPHLIFIGLFQIQNNGYYRRYFQCPDGRLLLSFDHYSHTPVTLSIRIAYFKSILICLPHNNFR